MIDNNKHINEALLAKFLSGETNEAEMMSVLDWIGHSSENQQAFEKFEKVWALTGSDSSYDADVAWGKVDNKITPKTRNLFSVYAAVAAIILLVLMFGVLLTYHGDQITHEYSVATLTVPVEDVLPDGTEVIVAENSQLDYHYNKRTNTRTTELEGEAFFNVKRDTTQKFIVNTSLGGVEVLGTSFNVDVLENNDVKVDVRSGVVKLFLPQESHDTIFLIITKGESGLISASSSTIEKLIQPSSSFFLIDSTISFRNMKLQQIFEDLEKTYAVQIQADSSVNIGMRFSSSFKQNTIDEILTVITETFNLGFRKVDDIYIIEDNEK